MIAQISLDPVEKEQKFNQSHQRFELALQYQPNFDLLLQGYASSLQSHAEASPEQRQQLEEKLKKTKGLNQAKAEKQSQTLDYESVKD